MFVEASAEELVLVEEIKLELFDLKNPHHFTDISILRFLRGRQQNKEKAVSGLTRHVEWRIENEIDNIMINTESFQSELDQRKVFNEGYDLHKRPLVILIARRHHKDKRNIDEIKSYIIYTLEMAMNKSKKEEEQILILFDLSQFSLSCMDYEVVKMLVNILQFNYPDVLSKAIIINSPLIFSACWQIIRLMLDPVTAAKCVFLRPNQLHEYIDASEIPSDINGITSTPVKRVNSTASSMEDNGTPPKESLDTVFKVIPTGDTITDSVPDIAALKIHDDTLETK